MTAEEPEGQKVGRVWDDYLVCYFVNCYCLCWFNVLVLFFFSFSVPVLFIFFF